MLPAPPPAGRRWSSFVADPRDDGKQTRALHEIGNLDHRLRVEHSKHTLLLHLSDEDGRGWTTVAVDRATRETAVGQGVTQRESGEQAWNQLYDGGWG